MTEALLGVMWASGLAVGVAVLYSLRRNHLAMNSRLDELLASTNALSRAEGFAAGRANHLAEVRQAGEALDKGCDCGGK